MNGSRSEILVFLTDRWFDWEASYVAAVANSFSDYTVKTMDGGWITANETAAVEFAYKIFQLLQVDTEDEMDQWFENFQHGAVR